MDFCAVIEWTGTLNSLVHVSDLRVDSLNLLRVQPGSLKYSAHNPVWSHFTSAASLPACDQEYNTADKPRADIFALGAILEEDRRYFPAIYAVVFVDAFYQ